MVFFVLNRNDDGGDMCKEYVYGYLRVDGDFLIPMVV